MARVRLNSRRISGVWVLAALAAAGLFAACGSSNSDSSNGGGSAVASGGGASASSEADALAAAQRVVSLAKGELLYGPPTGAATTSQLRPPRASDIRVMANKPPTDKSIVFVSCSAQSGQCTHSGEIGVAFLAKLGIRGSVVQSDFTPAGNQRAMNAALAQKPGAIVLFAIAPNTIGPQLARARAQGISVIDGMGTEEIDHGNLDAYVPQGSSLYQIAGGAQMIVDTKAKGSIYWLSAPEFPELEVEAGTAYFKSACPSCKLFTGNETAAQVTNPVTMAQLINSKINANRGLDYIMLASACAHVQAGAQAARSSGSDTKLAAPGCGASAVTAMNTGQIPFATGEVEPWGTLAAIDQAFRLWAKKPPLPESQTGPAAYLITSDNTPDKSTTNVSYGKLDRRLLEKFDYLAPYEKAWGVNLRSVIENEP